MVIRTFLNLFSSLNDSSASVHILLKASRSISHPELLHSGNTLPWLKANQSLDTPALENPPTLISTFSTTLFKISSLCCSETNHARKYSFPMLKLVMNSVFRFRCCMVVSFNISYLCLCRYY